jgi:hypothetical protein
VSANIQGALESGNPNGKGFDISKITHQPFSIDANVKAKNI